MQLGEKGVVDLWGALGAGTFLGRSRELWEAGREPGGEETCLGWPRAGGALL